MPETVNGLVLPQFLVELIGAGRWKRPADAGSLGKLTGVEHAQDFELFTVEKMASNTKTMVATFEQRAELFQLSSSARGELEASNVDRLDVDRAILIGATFEEEFLALDYRSDNPCIRVTDYSSKPMKWREIAVDIESFANILRL
jgi:hypothetical protein